jgi:peptidoglycan/LPS O-acetylase OafA/YrhL
MVGNLLNEKKGFRFSHSSSLVLHLVRGVTAQLVVFGHALSFFDITQKMSFVQNSGVVVFFVLSGIVIPYSAMMKKEVDSNYTFTSYFIDRFSRIYTGFLPGLLLVALLDLLQMSWFESLYEYSGSYNLRTFVGNLFMLQDHPIGSLIENKIFQQYFGEYFMNPFSVFDHDTIFVVTSFGSGRPFWTIAVEWWIYMLFGWIVFGNSSKKLPVVAYWTLLLLFLVVPVFHLINGGGNGLAMMWIMGLIIYIILSSGTLNLPSTNVYWAAGMFFVFAILRLAFLMEAYDLLYAALLSISLFFLLCGLQKKSGIPSGKVVSLIRFLANYSFSLYLVHHTILEFTLRWLGPGWKTMIFGIVLSNLLAIVIYLVFERNYKKAGKWLKNLFGVRPIQPSERSIR